MTDPPSAGRSGSKSSIPIGMLSGSDATDRLRETIVKLDDTTKRQTKWLIRLTWALVVMTAVLVILTVVLVARDA